MRLSTFVLVAVAAITVSACSDSAGPDGTRLAELAQQESLWQKQDMHYYLFDFHYQFGGEIEDARIYVVADTVAEAMDLQADTALSVGAGHDWPTVEDLFAHAAQALSSNDVDVTIEYDPELGYPTRIDVSPVVATPAGGSSTRASGLERLGSVVVE
ncbi:MAG TPA: DUF6174 domain-containing protein [Gemmatimonadaceae bacterium]